MRWYNIVKGKKWIIRSEMKMDVDMLYHWLLWLYMLLTGLQNNLKSEMLNKPDHRKISQNEKKWILQSFQFLRDFFPTTSSAKANSGGPSSPAKAWKLKHSHSHSHSPSNFIYNLTKFDHSKPKFLTWWWKPNLQYWITNKTHNSNDRRNGFRLRKMRTFVVYAT